jgi:hypothetical protein
MTPEKRPTSAPPGAGASAHPGQEAPKLLDELRAAIRLRHYSIRTEHAYCDWVVRYLRYHGSRLPMAIPNNNGSIHRRDRRDRKGRSSM